MLFRDRAKVDVKTLSDEITPNFGKFTQYATKASLGEKTLSHSISQSQALRFESLSRTESLGVDNRFRANSSFVGKGHNRNRHPTLSDIFSDAILEEKPSQVRDDNVSLLVREGHAAMNDAIWARSIEKDPARAKEWDTHIHDLKTACHDLAESSDPGNASSKLKDLLGEHQKRMSSVASPESEKSKSVDDDKAENHRSMRRS